MSGGDYGQFSGSLFAYEGSISHAFLQTQAEHTWIDEAIAEIEIRFAKRQEHFDYDIYLGDFLRGNEEEIEGVIAALAAVGKGKYYVRVKIVRKQDGHDIWTYPSPFGQPGVLEESQCYDEQVENILELDKLVGHIER